ncbi:MAG TPA: sigma 54-interacting transcriptional regulator [Kofleriaceae bacterium]|nr:sigma 54-interacting transcriptional regulator [Kofleriaceae bacterium]
MEHTLEPGGTLPARLEARSGSIRAPCLIVALDGARPLDAPSRYWLNDADEVSIGRSDRTLSAEHQIYQARLRLRLRLPDALVSARHAAVRREGGAWAIEDQRSTNGTLVNGAAVERAVLADGDVIAIGGTFLVFRDVALPKRLEPSGLDDLARRPEGIRTMSPELECRFADLASAARSVSSIVILGQTGTGKERVAQAVHELSERREGPFVAINCASIPASLIEGELFGHAKGAFTGATHDREGLIAAAEHGTLFLDEIGELPLTMQASLLRVLESGEVRPLGATRSRRLDLRVVVATNRDLPAMVAKGEFRDDLWARLNGFTLQLPALRNRREDMGLLLSSLLLRRGPRALRPLSREAAAALFTHEWPFNIRELDKVIEYALALSATSEIGIDALPPTVLRAPAAPEQALRRELLERLHKHGGNVAEVAREMGKHRQQVQKWCKRLQIDVDAMRPRRPDRL